MASFPPETLVSACLFPMWPLYATISDHLARCQKVDDAKWHTQGPAQGCDVRRVASCQSEGFFPALEQGTRQTRRMRSQRKEQSDRCSHPSCQGPNTCGWAVLILCFWHLLAAGDSFLLDLAGDSGCMFAIPFLFEDLAVLLCSASV